MFVEFARPSALDEYRAGLAGGVDLARRAATDAKAGIASLTDGLLADFRGAEGTGELFRTSNAVAGVAMRADAAAVRELAARPDVRSVRRILPARPANSSAVQLGRAVQAWQQTGRLGDGVRIGVVDTGIDYTHATFGGPGTRAAFEAVDPTKVDPATFPTEKVVGGIDLAGDAYDADNTDPARTVPHPDPNPLDCEGHGTHVAGTAAGYGVGADGTTFRGDYAALTPDELGRMSIGPGAAPKASLYGIRVFGCTGSTDLTALALDHALDPNGDGDFADHLDVVNLSLGTAFGAVDDPVNDFVRALTAGGVLVVAAAGNAGDVYDSGGNPGNSPDALAVASVRDESLLLDGAEVAAPAGIGVVAGQYSVEYERLGALDLRAPVVELGGPNAEGCAPYATGDAERVRGKLVWLAWADGESERACGSAPRAANAFAAGAAGVLLPSGESDFGAAIAGTADIPMFQLTGTATAAVRPALAAGAAADAARRCARRDDPADAAGDRGHPERVHLARGARARGEAGRRRTGAVDHIGGVGQRIGAAEALRHVDGEPVRRRCRRPAARGAPGVVAVADQGRGGQHGGRRRLRRGEPVRAAAGADAGRCRAGRRPCGAGHAAAGRGRGRTRGGERHVRDGRGPGRRRRAHPP